MKKLEQRQIKIERVSETRITTSLLHAVRYCTVARNSCKFSYESFLAAKANHKHW